MLKLQNKNILIILKAKTDTEYLIKKKMSNKVTTLSETLSGTGQQISLKTPTKKTIRYIDKQQR